MHKTIALICLLALTACNQSPSPTPPANLKVDISNPNRDAYVRDNLSVQVVFSGGKPDSAQLLKNGQPLVELIAPYSYVWDTRNEAEGTYELVARGLVNGKNVDSTVRKVVIDRTPPTLVGQTPSPDSENVWNQEPITATFSEPILPSSLTRTNIQLFSTGARKTGPESGLLKEFKLSQDGKTLSVVPGENYLGRTGYALYLGEPPLANLKSPIAPAAASPITDLAGNPLADSYWNWGMPEWHYVGDDLDVGPRSSLVGSMKLDPSGHPVVTWVQFEKDRSLDQLLVKRWNGQAWVKLGEALNVGTKVQIGDPRLVLDGAGNPVVVWNEGLEAKLPQSHVYVKRWNPGENTWEQLGKAINENGASYFSSIVLDSNSNPVVAYSERGDGEGEVERLYVKRWNGTSWDLLGGEQPLNVTENFSATRPSISRDKTGSFYVAWTEGGTFVKKLLGKEWVLLGDTLNESPSLQSASAALALDSQNRPVVAWAERDPELSNSTVWVKRWDGKTWSALWGTAGACMAPSLALDKSDGAVVACKGLKAGVVYLYNSIGQTGPKIRFFSYIQTGTDWPMPYADAPAGVLALDETGFPAVALSLSPDPARLDLSVQRWNGRGGRQEER